MSEWQSTGYTQERTHTCALPSTGRTHTKSKTTNGLKFDLLPEFVLRSLSRTRIEGANERGVSISFNACLSHSWQIARVGVDEDWL